MTDDYPDITEQGDQAGAPELRLWRSALTLLVLDARNHWHEKKGTGRDELRAFNDLCRCGPMTRWLCSMTGDNPEAVSEAFRGWCREAG